MLLKLQHVRCVLIDTVQLLIGRLGMASSIFGTCILEPNLLGASGGKVEVLGQHNTIHSGGRCLCPDTSDCKTC